MSNNKNTFDRLYYRIYRTEGLDNTIRFFIDKFCDTDEYVDETDFIDAYIKLLDAIDSDIYVLDLLKDIHICVYDNYYLIKKIIKITISKRNITYSDFIEIHFYDEDKKIFDYFIEKSILSNITPSAYYILYLSGKISNDTHTKMIKNKSIADEFFIRSIKAENIDNIIILINNGYKPSAYTWNLISGIIDKLIDDNLNKLFDALIEKNILEKYILITFIETKSVYIIEKLIEMSIDILSLLIDTKLSSREITMIKKLIF